MGSHPHRKPKILFLTQLPPPVHGSAVMNQYLFNSQLVRQTFDVTWIDISLDKSLGRIGQFAISKIWSYVKINLNLIVKLLTIRFDAAYCTIAPYGMPLMKDSLLIWWLKIFKIKIIFHMHGKGIHEELISSGWKKKYYNFIFRNTSVIHLSESLLTDLMEIDTIKKKFTLSNGIPGYSPEKMITEPVQILYLSNFFETKGAYELLSTARIMVEQKVDFHLRLVGGWPDLVFKKKLLDFYNSVNWDGKVEILGPLYGASKEKVFKGSNILVFPSRYRMECFPLVILEAMSCGLVIMASRVGAVPEILENGELGILVDPNNTQEFASAIIDILDDKERLSRLSNRSMNAFEQKFSFPVFENNFVRIIKEISDKNS
jgi:glycosyltransferase involved in cell wall biosynthesis